MARDSRYKYGHRAKKNALDRVKEIQDGEAGKATTYRAIETVNRHERRRFAKGAKIYDREHGEGAANRGLQKGAELAAYEEAALKLKPSPADALAIQFVDGGRGKGTSVRTQGPLAGRLPAQLHAHGSKNEPDKDKGG